MSNKTIEKAYGHVPKEVGYTGSWVDFIPTRRGIKYYWYRLLRKITR